MVQLDHVVYFTKHSPAEIVTQQKQLNRHAVIGGSHEKWGTTNALKYVKNAYIEWLSIEHLEIAKHSDHQLVRQLIRDVRKGDRWGTVCFSVKNIEAFEEKLQLKGFSTSGVLKAERKTANGIIRKWKMLFIEQTISKELPWPFFIEWELSDEDRFEQLRQDGTIQKENEGHEIKTCQFSVQFPEKAADEWARLLDAKVEHSRIVQLANVQLEFRKQTDRLGDDRLTDVIIKQL